MWTEKAQNRLWNICGQRRPRTDFETYADNEDLTDFGTYVDNEDPTDFGTYVDRDGPEQTSEYIWTEKAQNRCSFAAFI